MESFPAIIKRLRVEKGIPLRTVAAFLDVDQAILSKIERKHRRATREQVLKLADYFSLDTEALLLAWLSDKIFDEIKDDALAPAALEITLKKVLGLKNG